MMQVTFNDYGLRAKLDNYTANLDGKIKLGLRDASIILERQIVKNVSGQSHTRFPGNPNPFIGVVTGNLRKAVGYTVTAHAARIGVQKYIPYAAIHEFGGTILRSKGGKSWKIKIPKRSYIAPAFADKRDKMVQALQNQLMKGLTR